jgi:hypothetical protein
MHTRFLPLGVIPAPLAQERKWKWAGTQTTVGWLGRTLGERRSIAFTQVRVKSRWVVWVPADSRLRTHVRMRRRDDAEENA